MWCVVSLTVFVIIMAMLIGSLEPPHKSNPTGRLPESMFSSTTVVGGDRHQIEQRLLALEHATHVVTERNKIRDSSLTADEVKQLRALLEKMNRRRNRSSS